MKTLLATLLLIAGCISGAAAASLAEVQVIDRTTGQSLETWRHRGRLYVAGTPGNRYAVSLRNRSDGRVLTVISVDGVNAVSGETANASQSGYVLAPGQSAEIAGWRKSLEEVAAFYFTRIGDSYAARTERPQNVGVIGVAVFNEYVPPTPPAQIGAQEKAESSADNATGSAARSAAKAAPAPAAEAKLGTGHGERIAARVGTTEFRRQSTQPNEVITIFYDSRANLIARGIIPGTPRYGHPNPFPGGFVPDPKG
ncbi:MAG TPA: hypothetical protein VLS26_04150 [Azonexus sp.]|jgi:hypothetical protein|nr:hypothetical protein [Azonexus sp.]